MMLTGTHLTADCPYCSSTRGQFCINPLTRLEIEYPHLERIRAAQ